MSPIMQEILNEQEGWYSGELILLCKEKKTASRKKVETAT